RVAQQSYLIDKSSLLNRAATTMQGARVVQSTLVDGMESLPATIYYLRDACSLFHESELTLSLGTRFQALAPLAEWRCRASDSVLFPVWSNQIRNQHCLVHHR